MGRYSYFLVLVLASASFAVPLPNEGSDSGGNLLDEVVNELTKGNGIQKKIVDAAKAAVEAIDDLVQDVENKLIQISAEIGVINAEKINVTRNAIKKYHEVKHTLRITRNELKRLAHKTVLTTDDLLLYMEAWDSSKYSVSDQKEYLTEQVSIMRQLLSDSKTILGDAKTKYDKAASDIDTINADMALFKNDIQQMLDKDSAQHEAWASGVRGGFYTAAGGLSVLFGILDALGCLGICSGIGTTATWGTTVGLVEAEIARVEAKLAELETTVENAVGAVAQIRNQTTNLQKFIQQETILIIQWDNSVDHMNNNIGKALEASFYKLGLKRRVFTKSVRSLRDAAQTFLDQPDNIFGQEPLAEILENPVEMEKSLQSQTQVNEIIRNYNIQ